MFEKLETDLQRIIYIVEQAEDSGKRVGYSQISKILLDEYHIDLPRKRIIEIVQKKGNDKLKSVIRGGNVYLTVLTKGKKELNSVLKKPTQVDPDESLIPRTIQARLGDNFQDELRELAIAQNNQCPICVAFLLRKILEKVLFKAISNCGYGNELHDPNGNVVNLSVMLRLATDKSFQGHPVLSQRTANEMGRTKFLGDTAAHNPFSTVDMKTINSQLLYIVTALDELSQKMK